MKALLLLFLSVSFGLIGWRYVDDVTKQKVKQTISENIFPVIAGMVAVAVAVFFSMNTTLRIV